MSIFLGYKNKVFIYLWIKNNGISVAPFGATVLVYSLSREMLIFKSAVQEYCV